VFQNVLLAAQRVGREERLNDTASSAGYRRLDDPTTDPFMSTTASDTGDIRTSSAHSPPRYPPINISARGGQVIAPSSPAQSTSPIQTLNTPNVSDQSQAFSQASSSSEFNLLMDVLGQIMGAGQWNDTDNSVNRSSAQPELLQTSGNLPASTVAPERSTASVSTSQVPIILIDEPPVHIEDPRSTQLTQGRYRNK